METTKYPTVSEQTMVHLHRGILFSNEKEWTIYTCNNLKSPEKGAEWKKSQCEKVTYNTIPLK